MNQLNSSVTIFIFSNQITELIEKISNDFNFPPLGKYNTKLLENNFVNVSNKKTYDLIKKTFMEFLEIVNNLLSAVTHVNETYQNLCIEFNKILQKLLIFTKPNSLMRTIDFLETHEFTFENKIKKNNLVSTNTNNIKIITDEQTTRYNNFVKSVNHLQQIYNNIDLAIKNNKHCKLFLNTQFFECFCIKNPKIEELQKFKLLISEFINYNNHLFLKENYCKLNNNEIIKKKRNYFNECLGRLLQLTNLNSELRHLALLNKNNEFEQTNTIIPPDQIDCVTGDRIYPGVKNVITFNFSNGSKKIYYTNTEYLMCLLKFYIDKCTVEDVIIHDFQIKKSYGLLIRINDQEMVLPNFTVCEHLKCDEKEILDEYIENKIFKLIEINTLNDKCKYGIINCIRKRPKKCNKRIIFYKADKFKKVICECKMELCTRGCGKEYHGYSECNISKLDQTTFELDRIGNLCCCPVCKSRIIKSDGCNHMTCFCNIQFCYLCKKEFDKDEKGKYKINEHYSDNEIGLNLGSKCIQFQNQNII